MHRPALLSLSFAAIACASRPVPAPVVAPSPPPVIATAAPTPAPTPAPPADPAPVALPENPFAEAVAEAPAPAADLPPEAPGTFRGRDVEALLRDMATRPVVRAIERFSSSTMVFHLELEGGLEIAFKPSIRGEGSWWRHEIAGYRLARLLGIEARVPPAIFRRVPERVFGELARNANLVVHDGQVEGAAIFWMPVLRRSGLTEPASREQWSGWMVAGAPIPADQTRRASQIAALIAFDYLQANFDRWNSANVRMDERGDLVMRDNNRAWFEENLAMTDRGGIAHIERIPRALLPRIEAATVDALRTEVLRDPYRRHELLDRAQFRLYEVRRRILLGRVRELIAQHGENAVLIAE